MKEPSLTRREDMSPRFKINRNGTATLSGIPRHALSWILDAAAVSFYDRLSELRKEEDVDPEEIALIEDQVKLMQLLKERECEAKAATFPPRPPLSKGQRLAVVMNDRKERILLDSLLEAIIQEERHSTSGRSTGDLGVMAQTRGVL